VRATVLADKTAVIEEMLAGVRTLPLASEAEFLAGRIELPGNQPRRR
jgi:hypothetical protein